MSDSNYKKWQSGEGGDPQLRAMNRAEEEVRKLRVSLLSSAVIQRAIEYKAAKQNGSLKAPRLCGLLFSALDEYQNEVRELEAIA